MEFPIFADPSLNDVANSWNSLNKNNQQLNLENNPENAPARSWKIEDFNGPAVTLPEKKQPKPESHKGNSNSSSKHPFSEVKSC